MLANEEQLKGIDLPEMFSQMLGEIPWAALRAYIQSNPQLLKVCTLGGHRLDAKRRKRISKRVTKEAEKADYSQAFCNGVFAVWYPVHEELHGKLEEYFHSEEYTAIRDDRELPDDEYVLPDEKFEEFFSIEELPQWRVLLCFSPLRFSEEQAGRILDDSAGNTDLLARLAELEEQVSQLERQATQAVAEKDRFLEQFQQANAEATEAKKQVRELRAESESLSRRTDSMQAENRRLRQELDEYQTHRESLETEIQERYHGDILRLGNDVQRLEAELADWQSRYEEQRVENKRLDEQALDARKELRVEQERVALAEKRAEELDVFVDNVLQHIDWPKVGAQLRLTTAMRRQFNSLVKKLDYGDDLSLTIEETLPAFWESLMAKERELIESIAKSNTQEVIHGDVEGYWLALTDAFGDVRISLEARLVILNILQEIFYQVLELEDLEKMAIPVGKRRTKSSS